MPIDIEGLKKRHGKGAKTPPEKPEEPIVEIVEPLIKEKKSSIKIEQENISEQEYRKELINGILKKRKLKKSGDMTKQKKKPIKGKSSLGGARSTIEDYDSMFGLNTETQQNTPNKANIGVNQPINNDNELVNIVQDLNANNGRDANNITIPQLGQLGAFMKAINPNQQSGDVIRMMALMMQQNQQNMEIRRQQDQQNAELQRENSEMRFSQMVQAFGGNKGDPKKEMIETASFIRQLQGDQRTKNKDEMHYDIEKRKLDLQEYARRDMLDREERQVVRDDVKSQRIMDIGGVVLDKVIGNNLSQFIGDMVNVKGEGGGKGKKAPTSARQDFDPSLLDEL